MNVIFHRQKTKHVASELRGPGLKNPARHQLRINKSCEKMWTGIKHHKGSNLTLSSHLTSNIFQHELWNWETPQTWEFYLSCFCPKKILRKGSLPIVFPQVVLHWGSHTFPRCFRTGESMMTSSGTIGIPSDHPKPPTKFPFLSGLADQTPSRSIKNQWKTMENPSKQINKNIKRPSNTIKHQSITIKDHQKQSTTNQKNNHTPSRTNGKHIKHQEIQQATTNNAKKKKTVHQVIWKNIRMFSLLRYASLKKGPQIRSPFRSFSLWQRLVGPWWLHHLGVDRSWIMNFAKVSRKKSWVSPPKKDRKRMTKMRFTTILGLDLTFGSVWSFLGGTYAFLKHHPCWRLICAISPTCVQGTIPLKDIQRD